MNKIWLVIKREYLFNLRRPAFLFAAFGTPIFFVAIIALSIFFTTATTQTIEDIGQVGYVDPADVLDAGIQVEEHPDLFIEYESEDAALAALDAGTVGAYFTLAEDYLDTGGLQLYSYDGTPSDLRPTINDFILNNLTQGRDLGVPANAIIESPEMTVRVEGDGRTINQESLPGLILFPLIFAVVFVLATNITSGFLMSGLVDEKTNRVIEMLITSMTPEQLLLGKIIGLFLLGLTQLAVWIGTAFLVVQFGADIPFLSGITLPADLLVFGLIYFLLGYLLVAGVMAGIGAVVESEQESRQYAFFISFPLFVPYFFIFQFFTNPEGPIPVALSLIPFTAPMSMIMRLGLSTVPLWQVALSVGLLLLTTALFVWMSVKVFRWGLLLYGKQFRPREILAVIRGNPYEYNQKEQSA